MGTLLKKGKKNKDNLAVRRQDIKRDNKGTLITEIETIKQYANEIKRADILLMVQILEEIQGMKALLKKCQDTCNRSNNGSRSTDNSEYKHS